MSPDTNHPDCYGIASDNERCGLSAGYGTDSDLFCTYHEDQHIEMLTVPGDDEAPEMGILAIGAGETGGDGWDGYERLHIQTPTGHRLGMRPTEVSTDEPVEDVTRFFE